LIDVLSDQTNVLL